MTTKNSGPNARQRHQAKRKAKREAAAISGL
jgi:hypothetical protein